MYICMIIKIIYIYIYIYIYIFGYNMIDRKSNPEYII